MVDSLKFCENCGTQIKPDAQFCNACLSKTTAEASPPPAYATEQKPLHRPYATDKDSSQFFRSLKKLIKTLAFLLLSLLALVGLIAIFIFGSFASFFNSQN